MQNLPQVPSQLGKQQQNIATKIKLERIFLIAETGQLTELIEYQLKEEGYQVEVFYDGISAAIAIHQREPSLVILDWNACSFSNFNTYYCLRSTNKYVPVIALTEKQNADSRIDILNSGADYCISQPFSMPEFLAIINARLRQNRQEKSPILLFEDLELNTLSRRVYRGERLINLTAKEFNLLEYLMLHPLQVLTRVQIIESIWGFDFMGDSNIIEVYIRYLRIKLEAKQEKRLIHTVRSVGYVLRSG
ncbi:MAG: response regulator transcription factor [Cyanobacteria bacterium P01_C01_bin.72]